jgi:hypothetical protein
MGHFSFLTQDTEQSCLIHEYTDKNKTYYLWDNKGQSWKETRYDGDGVFGGKDFFVLLAEMNGWIEAHMSDDDIRDLAIFFYDETDTAAKIKWPNITEASEWTWKNERPEMCPNQGFELSS